MAALLFITILAAMLLGRNGAVAAPMDPHGRSWHNQPYAWSQPPEVHQQPAEMYNWPIPAQNPPQDHYHMGAANAFSDLHSNHFQAVESSRDHHLQRFAARPEELPSSSLYNVEGQSPSRSLDHKDLEFLDSLLADLSEQGHTSLHSTRDDKRGASNSRGPTASSFRTSEGASSVGSSNVPPRKERSYNRAPEPLSIRELQTLEPLRTQQVWGDLRLKPDQQVRERINREVFGGHLQWIHDRQLQHITEDGYRRRWPIQRASRVLPHIRFSTPDGKKFQVHITHHTLVNTRMDASSLEDPTQKTLYMFWGVPEDAKGPDNLVHYYGAGRFRWKDYKRVEEYLGPIMSAVRQASREHM